MITAIILILVISLTASIWVAQNAKMREMNSWGWGFFVLLIPIIAFPLYFRLRNPKPEKKELPPEDLQDDSPVCVLDKSSNQSKYITKKEWLVLEKNHLTNNYKLITSLSKEKITNKNHDKLNSVFCN